MDGSVQITWDREQDSLEADSDCSSEESAEGSDADLSEVEEVPVPDEEEFTVETDSD